MDIDKEDHVWILLNDGSRVHISWLESEDEIEATSNKNTVR